MFYCEFGEIDYQLNFSESKFESLINQKFSETYSGLYNKEIVHCYLQTNNRINSSSLIDVCGNKKDAKHKAFSLNGGFYLSCIENENKIAVFQENLFDFCLKGDKALGNIKILSGSLLLN